MRDLEFPLLTPRIVAGLTGLSPRTLRRWEARGIPPASPRGRMGRPSARKAPVRARLYSWRDVEKLQQASHLVKSRRLRLDDVRRFLEQGGTAMDRDWVIARPKPPTRKPRAAGGAAGFARDPGRRRR